MAGEEGSVKVRIDNVRKVFNTRNGEMIALNGVTLDIEENEFISLAAFCAMEKRYTEQERNGELYSSSTPYFRG